MPQSPNLHASPQMETVLLAAKTGAALDPDTRNELKPSADKAIAKGWIETNGISEDGFLFKLTPAGVKVCELLKL